MGATLPKKYIVLRADGNARIGTGHVMRSLALAQAWQDQGGRAVFLMDLKAPALGSRLQSEGMEVVSLSSPPGTAGDAHEATELARRLGAGWVVVDGCHFGASYQRQVREAGLKLLFIDDIGSTEENYANLILNQNLHAQADLYPRLEAGASLLLGPRYALLRREFEPWRDQKRQIVPAARKVLVTLGGGDPDNVTLKVMQALGQVELMGLEVLVVVGASNPHQQELRSASRQLPYSLRLEQNVTNMPELMAWADLAITAGGSTCWELAFMGLPGLIIILADNQAPVGHWIDKLGIGVNLGWHASLSPVQISQATIRLLASPGIREEMTANGQALVNGEGAARVLMLVNGQRLRLRRVRDDDCRLLWQWANDPEVRKVAFSVAYIPWEDHLRWFAHKKSDLHCLHFIAVDDQDRPVGQVRFDIKEGDNAEIDVSIAKEKRGSGYGKLILELAAKELFRTTTVRAIDSFIKIDNIRSIKAFEKAKYKRIGPLTIQGEPSVHYVMERVDARWDI